jgi:hypothetical protein
MWRDLKLPRPDLLLKFFQVLTVVPDEYDAVAFTEGFFLNLFKLHLSRYYAITLDATRK